MNKILLRLLITVSSTSGDFKWFLEWLISPSPALLMSELNSTLEELFRELHVATWKAYAIKAYISNVEIFVDGKLATHTSFFPALVTKINPEKIREVDHEIFSSINYFISMAGPEIAFEVISNEKFMRQ